MCPECPEDATSHVEGDRRRVPPQSTTSNIAEYRQQVALKTNLQGTLKTRYFSVYLACVRVSCFCEGLCGHLTCWAITVPGGRSVHPEGLQWKALGQSNGAPRSHHHDRVPTHRVQISLLQGTLKTRYFSVYLAYMHAKRCLGGRFGRSRGVTKERLRQAPHVADKHSQHRRKRHGIPS